MSLSECRQSFVAFGFTDLEAEVYVFLLGESPATGYRVAKALGKPVANTYKAIESLRNKGALVMEAGGGRLCRAIPIDELLGQLERRFQEQRDRAGRALARLKVSPEDQHIYQLHTPAQVLERCRRMLRHCRRVAVVDAFPRTLEELRPGLEAAAERGIAVAAKAYRPVVVAGADVVAHPDGEAILRRWPGQWLNLVTDGLEFVMAFLTEDGTAVHQAVWSGSAYLSTVYHSAVASEVTLGMLDHLMRDGASANTMRRALRRYRYLFTPDMPGTQELVKRFAGPRRATPQKLFKRKKGAS
jgi:sugar-specific transcriptional regulator TrmB